MTRAHTPTPFANPLIDVRYIVQSKDRCAPRLILLCYLEKCGLAPVGLQPSLLAETTRP